MHLWEQHLLYPIEREEIFTDCEECGEPILKGEKYYKILGRPICENCVNSLEKWAEED